MTTTEDVARVCRLAAHQHHLITRPQLVQAGISTTQIRDWSRSRFLQSVEREVYLVAGGELTWAARLLSACLVTGAVASHRSALALHGLEGGRPGRPEVTVPNGECSFRRSDIRVHESTDLDLIRPVVRDSIPTTPVARTVLDLGAVNRFAVEDAARDAVGQRLTTWPELFSTLVAHSRKGRRGCGPLRAVLDEHYGDQTESNLERRFLRLVRLGGLPIPQQQFDVVDHHGFITRVDFGYPDLLIAIEIDSVLHHATRRAFEADRFKRNRLKIAGWLLLEITSQRMRERPASVCQQLAAAIHSRQGVLSGGKGVLDLWRPKERRGATRGRTSGRRRWRR